MGITKYVDFDLYMNRAKVHSKDHLFELLTQDTAPLCSLTPKALLKLCNKPLGSGEMSAENGIAIFDVTSHSIEKPVMVLMTLENGIALGAADNKAVDLFIGVFSPGKNVSAHLQRLSSVARLFRSEDLLKALRGARSTDEMKVLFMPTQDWMVAA